MATAPKDPFPRVSPVGSYSSESTQCQKMSQQVLSASADTDCYLIMSKWVWYHSTTLKVLTIVPIYCTIMVYFIYCIHCYHIIYIVIYCCNFWVDANAPLVHPRAWCITQFWGVWFNNGLFLCLIFIYKYICLVHHNEQLVGNNRANKPYIKFQPYDSRMLVLLHFDQHLTWIFFWIYV